MDGKYLCTLENRENEFSKTIFIERDLLLDLPS